MMGTYRCRMLKLFDGWILDLAGDATVIRDDGGFGTLYRTTRFSIADMTACFYHVSLYYNFIISQKF